MTASIGVATFPAARIENVVDLFARADAALYRAKADGRDRVRM
jgi:two-component system cell cycle response regulator